METQIYSARQPITVIAPGSLPIAYRPECNPFQSIIVDVTHRCNMECRNCYIPNREIPDMDVNWMCAVLARLPARTRIRIAGAEPTVRRDLPEIIRRIRKLGHLPILMTNGLKLATRSYVKRLKQAGLRTVYLSFNGGFDDEMYRQIDGVCCANRKARALENLYAENMYISLGMIIVRGLNEGHLGEVFHRILHHRQVYELHARSIGPYGRFMKIDPYTLEELIEIFSELGGVRKEWIQAQHKDGSYVDFKVGRLKVQLTQWPDLGSLRRGRLAPDGTIQPFFEHMIANEGGY